MKKLLLCAFLSFILPVIGIFLVFFHLYYLWVLYYVILPINSIIAGLYFLNRSNKKKDEIKSNTLAVFRILVIIGMSLSSFYIVFLLFFMITGGVKQ